MPYRRLLAAIKAELEDPFRRCPECEEPGYPVLLAWPAQSQRRDVRLYRRWLLCTYCGHKTILWKSHGGTPGNKAIFSEEQELQICEMYKAGDSSTDVAKKMYCNPGTVRKVLKKHGVPIRPPRRGSNFLRGTSIDELRRIHFLYVMEGWSQRRIGKYLGIPEGTVNTRVRQGRKIGLMNRFKQPAPPPKRIRPKRVRTKRIAA